MTEQMTPLRRRMIDDMMMRNLSPNTQETYIRSVAQFSAFHRRSPDKLGVEHLRDFHLHLVSRGLVANSIAVKMAALRFFFVRVLKRRALKEELPTPKRHRRLPTVLSPDEVRQLHLPKLRKTAGPTSKTAATYITGSRGVTVNAASCTSKNTPVRIAATSRSARRHSGGSTSLPGIHRRPMQRIVSGPADKHPASIAGSLSPLLARAGLQDSTARTASR